MRAAELLRDAGRPIAYHAGIARALGSIPAALMLTQLIYWTDKTADEDGWVWKLEQDWDDELAITAEQLRGARSVLTKLGLVDHRRSGMPARPYYRVDVDALDVWWEATFPPDLIGQNARTGQGIFTGQDGAKCPDTPLLDIDDAQERTSKRRTKPVPCTFPERFILTDALKDWATREAPNVDLSLHTKMFAIYWREGDGRGKKKTDWAATWKNWMLRESARAPRLATSSATRAANGYTPVSGADAVMSPTEHAAFMAELDAERAQAGGG